MTNITQNNPIVVPALLASEKSVRSCGGAYYLFAFLVPFCTVTIMYVLGNVPLHDLKVLPVCLLSGLLAGASGYLLYKGIKAIKHVLLPHQLH